MTGPTGPTEHPAQTPPSPPLPSGNEASAPAAPAVQPTAVNAAVRPSERPPLRSERQWPPAYESKPSGPDNGRPGVIIFDEEPTPPAVNGTARAPRPVVLVDLVRKINAVCGKQARDVVVELQRDGSLLVKVKVAKADEKQLMSKILRIPEMTTPNIRLAVEVIQ